MTDHEAAATETENPVGAVAEPENSTPEEVAAPDETDERIGALEDNLTEVKQLLASQTAVLSALSDAVLSRPEVPVELPAGTPNPEDFMPKLPKGTVRFRSLQFTDLTVIHTPGFREVINGRFQFHEPEQVNFSAGIADVKDKKKIEWMREHDELGVAFIEDEFATPMQTGPNVVDGPRGSGNSPRGISAGKRGALSAPLN